MNLDDELRENRAAVDEFISLANHIDEERAWHLARADGKWTPAEIAEHVALTYETLLDEAEGGVGMKIVTKWWRRLLLRALVVPRMLRDRAFPPGARAPRELRPKGNVARADALARISSSSARLLKRVAGTPRSRWTHAYFGKLETVDGLRFLAMHTRHHAAQLRESVAQR